MRSIILDLDGTILDSRYRHKKLLYDLLLKRMPQLKWKDLDDFLKYKSDGYSTFQYLKKKFPRLKSKDIANEWVNEIEEPFYLKFDQVYSDTYEFLSILHSKYYLILLTARKNQMLVIQQLEEYALINFFCDIQVVSPDKKKILHNYPNEDEILAVVGDTEKDKETADHYNCDFYALSRGFRSKKFWENQGISSHTSLFEILEKIEQVR
jgi:phosphoglycolate phosphatase-like HAD superfamily hydrolase